MTDVKNILNKDILKAFGYECDGCDYQYFIDGVEHCEKDPDDKNPLCPLIPVFESEDK